MIEYIIGFVLTVFLILFYQLFGTAITKNNTSYSYNFVLGFLFFSFFVAIAGVPIQIFKLPWMMFFIYMILIFIIILSFIIYTFIKFELFINKKILCDYFKENWFIYLGAFVLLISSLFKLGTILSNNLTDDGYYLNKIATFPYIDNPFSTDPVTGFKINGFGSYSLNTYELEASFYVYLFRISAVVYAKVFLSFLNYFLIIHVIKAFFEKLNVYFDIRLNKNYIQYILIIILLMFVSTDFCLNNQELWTFRSAGFFGSSITRMCTPFILLIPLIDIKKITFKEIILTVMSCVVMISKSTIAVPTIFVIGISYLIVYFYKRSKVVDIALVITIFIVGFFLPNIENINKMVFDNFVVNSTNVFLIFSIIILVVLSLNNLEIRNFTSFVVIIVLCMLLPGINDIFENLSIYGFVGIRSILSIEVLFIFTSFFVLLSICLSKIPKILIKNFILFLLVMCVFYLMFPLSKINENKQALVYLKNNINLTPNITIKLGDALENYYKETGKSLNTLMTSGISIIDYHHFPAAIIRSISPHTVSITGSLRTSTKCKNRYSEFYGFSIEDIKTFDNFTLNPNIESATQLEQLVNKYPIDCIVGISYSEKHELFLNTLGFERYSVVSDSTVVWDYKIYIRKKSY